MRSKMMNMLALCVITMIFPLTSARFHNYKENIIALKPLDNLGKPLILSSYLEANEIEKARSLSEVNYEPFSIAPSYSGYLTVDKENNGSLFFWFFPSADDYKKDPVVLWLQGGPGSSSLFGLFTENGPFSIVNGTIAQRKYSWNRNQSVLYIDQPVGTGFSFTNGNLVENQTQVGEHLYTALTQFFSLFPEIRNNEFFIAGESYAGKYIPSIGHTIHQKNPTVEDSLKINLQGMLIGNGLSDPRHQIKYGDLLYQLGLIDRIGLEDLHDLENAAISYIEQEDYYHATLNFIEIMQRFKNYTGLHNSYNFLKDEDDINSDWMEFILQDEVRQAIHVEKQEYHDFNANVYNGLFADMTKSVVPWISELLSYYRMVLYNGQLDFIVGYVLTENYLQHLNFSAAAEYAEADRKIWTVGEKVAGYVKTAGNLTEILVRNAGHMAPSDQPEVAYDLLYKFVRNQSIVEPKYS